MGGTSQAQLKKKKSLKERKKRKSPLETITTQRHSKAKFWLSCLPGNNTCLKQFNSLYLISECSTHTKSESRPKAVYGKELSSLLFRGECLMSTFFLRYSFMSRKNPVWIKGSSAKLFHPALWPWSHNRFSLLHSPTLAYSEQLKRLISTNDWWLEDGICIHFEFHGRATPEKSKLFMEHKGMLWQVYRRNYFNNFKLADISKMESQAFSYFWTQNYTAIQMYKKPQECSYLGHPFAHLSTL